jgi:hypothetical protein
MVRATNLMKLKLALATILDIISLRSPRPPHVGVSDLGSQRGGSVRGYTAGLIVEKRNGRESVLDEGRCCTWWDLGHTKWEIVVVGGKERLMLESDASASFKFFQTPLRSTWRRRF